MVERDAEGGQQPRRMNPAKRPAAAAAASPKRRSVKTIPGTLTIECWFTGEICGRATLSGVQSLLLVRHARPLVSETAPASAWRLTTDGRRAAEDLGARLGIAGAHIVSSNESKAVQTAEALHPGTLDITADLAEVRRPHYDDAQEHRNLTARYLSGDALDEWEPQQLVIERFGRAIRGQHAVAVTHGTAMTLWLTTLVHLDDPFAFWSALRLPDAWHVDLAAGCARAADPSPPLL